jgi:hypothetical protein
MMDRDEQAAGGSEAPCPRCGHPLYCHNDAGTFGGGQGDMCCYYNDSGRQFTAGGAPAACGCSYSGPGTVRT